MSTHKLGALLREYDIKAQVLTLPTGQARGYLRSDFEDAWGRYCTDDTEAEEGTQVSEVSKRQPTHETAGQTP